MEQHTTLRSILTETVLSFGQAARKLPPFRQGRSVSPSTIWRWVTYGVRTPDGRRVRLEAIRLGGRWVTSLEALIRFSENQTPVRPEVELERPLLSGFRSPAQRQRASERAAEILRKAGIK